MKILIACEESGIVRDAFAKLGHDAWSCDLLPTDIPGNHIKDDVRKHLEGWDLIIAHPYCTHTAISGARWFNQKVKDGRQKKAIEFFMMFVNAPCDKICIEHPISIMSRIYRKPDQIIQPWMFGHGEVKRTCFWLKNLPLLKSTKIVNGREARIHKMPPSKDRSKLRSRTYLGIAKAMAEQWGRRWQEGHLVKVTASG